MSFSAGKLFDTNPSFRQRLKYTAGRAEMSRIPLGGRGERGPFLIISFLPGGKVYRG
jgi:hypothetical protein